MELNKAKQLERYRLKKLLALVVEYPAATNKELAERLGVSVVTVKSDLELLKIIKAVEGRTEGNG